MTIPAIDQVDQSQFGKEVLIDELFDALRAYFTLGIHRSASIGLGITFYGGRFGSNDLADQSLTLAASAINYIEYVTTTGVISSNTTGYSGGTKTALGIATTSSTGLASYVPEARAGGGSSSSGGVKVIQVAASDETTALTTGASKVMFRAPYAMTLTAVRASLSVAQTSGSVVTIVVKKNGVSIFSTNITIDNTEKTSVTAATPAVISTAAIADDDEISVDITQVGDGTARGLKVALIGS